MIEKRQREENGLRYAPQNRYYILECVTHEVALSLHIPIIVT